MVNTNVEISEIDAIVDILKGGVVLVNIGNNQTLSLKLRKDSLPVDVEDALEIIEGLWES